ncbi:uncharacterized protein LACBIDRAFT_332490 [Laccaria bicolor S238N-H82]|uniref:Predicted protein n=1 Tax=Laccaria bicolor (strain S238N-H82 / ATCC MYA-4686) TaxID=486041 RepID=B0DSW8_LACBS|nr:uncharacterized protein LACBIDRAFT_332490 [Laccaria bicolor S238N-H82]EDR02386.1 predicted protein [Laccaria bicolor S238N-H82]|eukprot:XP_001887063.1 predicted protein [Laccaria bicolor S238N-H82]
MSEQSHIAPLSTTTPQGRIEEVMKDTIERLYKLFNWLGNEDVQGLWNQLNPVFEDPTFSGDEFKACLDQWEEHRTNDVSGGSKKPLLKTSNGNGRVSSVTESSALAYYSIYGINSNKIPEGWTSLQWCIFATVGWPYELLIYQKRVENLMDQLIESQARALARGLKQADPSRLSEALKSLVKEKVKRQDADLRECLNCMTNGNEEQALFRAFTMGPFENTVLPLATFTLERALGMMRKAVVDIIDAREFMPFIFTMMGLRALIVARIKILQGPIFFYFASSSLAYFQFAAKFKMAKLNVSGTLPGLIYFTHQLNGFQMPCKTTTMAFSVFAIVNSYFHPDFSEFALEYVTWSDHLKSHPEKEGLDSVPAALNTAEDASLNASDGFPERGSVAFPFHSSRKNDLDLCSECYKLPLDEAKLSGHTAAHVLVKYVLNFPTPYREWMTALVKKRLEFFKDSTTRSKDAPICSECGEVIPDGSVFFVCVDVCCLAYAPRVNQTPQNGFSERTIR